MKWKSFKCSAVEGIKGCWSRCDTHQVWISSTFYWNTRKAVTVNSNAKAVFCCSQRHERQIPVYSHFSAQVFCFIALHLAACTHNDTFYSILQKKQTNKKKTFKSDLYCKYNYRHHNQWYHAALLDVSRLATVGNIKNMKFRLCPMMAAPAGVVQLLFA